MADPKDLNLARIVERLEALESAVSRIDSALSNEPNSSDGEQLDQLRDWVVDPKYRVKLQLLMNRETDRALDSLSGQGLGAFAEPFSDPALEHRVSATIATVESVSRLVLEGCYWGDDWASRIWQRAIERLANHNPEQSGLTVWLALRSLSATLPMYAGGVAAIASDHWSSVAALLQASVRDIRAEQSAATALVPAKALSQEAAWRLPKYNRRYTPANDLIFDTLRPWFSEVVPDDHEFERSFEDFEFMQGMVATDIRNGRGVIGRFAWRRTHYPADDVLVRFRGSIDAKGSDWPPLKAGLFGGDLSRANDVMAQYATFVEAASNKMF